MFHPTGKMKSEVKMAVFRPGALPAPSLVDGKAYCVQAGVCLDQLNAFLEGMKSWVSSPS